MASGQLDALQIAEATFRSALQYAYDHYPVETVSYLTQRLTTSERSILRREHNIRLSSATSTDGLSHEPAHLNTSTTQLSHVLDNLETARSVMEAFNANNTRLWSRLELEAHLRKEKD